MVLQRFTGSCIAVRAGAPVGRANRPWRLLAFCERPERVVALSSLTGRAGADRAPDCPTTGDLPAPKSSQEPLSIVNLVTPLAVLDCGEITARGGSPPARHGAARQRGPSDGPV